MTAQHDKRFRPELEPLEDRLAPAVLTVVPPGFIDPEGDLVNSRVADQAMHGLETAQGHSHGVVMWSLSM